MFSSKLHTLVFNVNETGKTLRLTATLDGKTHTYTVPERQKVCARLKIIYRLLNPWSSLLGTIHEFYARVRRTTGRPGIHALLTEVGRVLYAPVDAWIERASGIEFVVAEERLAFLFDALYYRGKPLFLHKQVSYSLHAHSDDPLDVSRKWKGLLISHESSDPERAALAVKDLFPGSFYYDDHDVDPEDLRDIVEVDFVLISGHGGPAKGIELENMPIRPETLVHMAPKLVYLDSCRLGLHRGFLERLHQTGTRYFLAPILNNESGESSTKTIQRFFTALSDGETPSNALFIARKTLYEHYSAQGDDFRLAMVRAFPFRIYRLN